MKLLKILTSSILAAATLCFVVSCDDDESSLARMVMASASSLTFDVDGGTQTITIYSDADWTCDYPDWVAVSPDKGSGVIDVDISVGDNYLDGTPNNPRTATLVFKGSTIEGQAQVVVSQDGDKYRGLQDWTLDQIPDLEDGAVVSVPDVLVAALGTTGFMVMGNDVNVYVTTDEIVEVGDIVTIIGDKGSSYGLPTLIPDSVEITSSGNPVTYPTPTDITGTIDSYSSTLWDYITVYGVMSGTILSIDDATYSVNVIDTPDEVGIMDLNNHKATLTGYYAGTTAPYVRMVVTDAVDEGSAYSYYFYENFEWMEPWAIEYGAGDNVATGDSGTEAPGIGQSIPDLEEELLARGYEFPMNPESTTPTHYLQRNYLKFGRNNYQGGITLPPMEDAIPQGANITISFDWCPMRGGTFSFDKVGVSVLVGEEEIASFGHSYVDNVDELAWIPVVCTYSGYRAAEDTRITIRSTQWGVSGYYRWFLDNIIIEDTDNPDAPPVVESISVSPTSLSYAYDGGEGTVTVSANGSWTASGPDWVTIEPASGTAGATVTITADSNFVETGSEERTGTVTFALTSGSARAEVALTQDGYNSYVEPDDKELEPVDGVYWSDDFEWLEPWSEVAGAPDSIADNSTDTGSVKQWGAVTYNGQTVYEALVERGYDFEATNLGTSVTIYNNCAYLQKNYLKFGKTDYQGAIFLPPLEGKITTGDVKLTFDWAPMMQGTGTMDTIQLQVIVTTGPESKAYDLPDHGVESGTMKWVSAEVDLSEVTLNSVTKIEIIPTNQWGASSTHRWFIDNIVLCTSSGN